MARTRINIDAGELQDAINQLEAARLFSSPHTLYVAVSETPWAHQVGATLTRIYFTIKEVNVDPDNPVITMRVKPTRRTKTRSEKAAVFDGFDLLMDAFRNRGVELTSVEQLITSSRNSSDENRVIMLAWADLRDKLGLPKPVKKTLGVQISTSPTVTEITELPITVEPIAEATDQVIAVTEEMPDGSQVTLQNEVEVELSGEPEVTLDLIPVELRVAEHFSNQQSSPMPVEPEEQQVQSVEWMPVVDPMPIRMTTVRPIPSRPTPIRSSLPPRSMPIV